MSSLRTSLCLVLVLTALLGGAIQPAAFAADGRVPLRVEDGDWVGAANAYRATAGLPPVVGRSSSAASKHARYVVRTNVITHHEDPSSPYYSVAGADAGRRGLVMATTRRRARSAVIDAWMVAPYHARYLIDPLVDELGFGDYTNRSGGGWEYAATLTYDRASPTPDVTQPVLWPAPGSGVPVRAHRSRETPDPLEHCPGYERPVGLPIVLRFVNPPDVGAHRLSVNGRQLVHCVVRDGNHVFLVPRHPLEAGRTYRVALNNRGRNLDWTFSVTRGAWLPATSQHELYGTSGAIRTSTVCPGGTPSPNFVDLARAAHPRQIRCMARWGVLRGSGRGRYEPHGVVTRGQMAAFLARALERTGRSLPAARDAFVDDERSVHEQAINLVAAAGITRGSGSRRYRPDEPVTRGQMATLLLRTAEWARTDRAPKAAADPFVDDNTSTHESSITRAWQWRLVRGTAPVTYRPASRVTRDQMAVFLARLLENLAAECCLDLRAP